MTQKKLALIGETLRARRKATGMTAEEAAKKAGIGQSTLLNIECGKWVGMHYFTRYVHSLGGYIEVCV